VRLVGVVAVAAAVAIAVAVALGELHVGKPAFVDRLQYPLRYEALLRSQAERFHLDGALLAAVVYEESRFRSDARSDAGAIGLMQLMPITGRTIARWTGGERFQEGDLYDPAVNVRYGAWYLRYLLDRYGDEELALAAYHAGATNVDEWLRHGKGIAFADTRAYIDDVRESKQAYRRLYAARLDA
jgi:soluble lytic murein transglycosylase